MNEGIEESFERLRRKPRFGFASEMLARAVRRQGILERARLRRPSRRVVKGLKRKANRVESSTEQGVIPRAGQEEFGKGSEA